MRQIAVFLIVLILLALAIPALAQQTGYIQTDTPPESGMFPIGTTFSLLVLNAQNGQFEHHPARIDHYIQWVNPARPTDYYVSLTDWPGAFWFFNRVSLEQWVTLQQMVAGLLKLNDTGQG